MDAQTIIAICALLSVVIGIVKLGAPASSGIQDRRVDW